MISRFYPQDNGHTRAVVVPEMLSSWRGTYCPRLVLAATANKLERVESVLSSVIKGPVFRDLWEYVGVDEFRDAFVRAMRPCPPYLREYLKRRGAGDIFSPSGTEVMEIQKCWACHIVGSIKDELLKADKIGLS